MDPKDDERDDDLRSGGVLAMNSDVGVVPQIEGGIGTYSPTLGPPPLQKDYYSNKNLPAPGSEKVKFFYSELGVRKGKRNSRQRRRR